MSPTHDTSPTTAAPVRPKPPPGMLTFGTRVAVPISSVAVVTALVLLTLTVAVSLATVSMGRLGIALPDLLPALRGESQGKDTFVLERLRGPRLVVGLGTGAALGLSGALFQSVTRNPLGSPDVIGLAAGAGAGASIAALLLPHVVPVSVGALAGGVLAMALVYVSTGSGFRNPGRLVVAGIGVAAMATAVTQYVVYVVERDKAAALTAYVNGSLAARSWDDAATIWLVLLLAAPFLALLSQHLRLSEMGDELAGALGSNPARTNTAAIVLSIVLCSAAVSVAGPIAFIALTAPQIARRLTRGTGPHLVLAALVGALLLALADLCAQQAPMFTNLPVGIYTMAIGGVYLGYLLSREWRRGVL